MTWVLLIMVCVDAYCRVPVAIEQKDIDRERCYMLQAAITQAGRVGRGDTLCFDTQAPMATKRSMPFG
jgi:3-dehydroquinate synthase class II